MRVQQLLAVLILAAAMPAMAAPVRDDFPAERLRLAPNRSGLIDVISGGVLEDMRFDAGFWIGYAASPLVVRRRSDGSETAALVANRVGGSLTGSIGLLGWAEVALELPGIFYQDRPAVFGVLYPAATLPALQVAGLGDLRITPKMAILHEDVDDVDLAVLVGISVPTGGGSNYLGDGDVTLSPEVAASRRMDAIRVGANLGATLRGAARSVGDLAVASEVNLRLGAGWRNGDHGQGPLEVATTLSGSTSLGSPFGNSNVNALEWRAQGSFDLNRSLQVFAGAGLALGSGWGTPDWRGFAGVRYGSPTEEPGVDTDGDRIRDENEARPECITQREDKDGFEDQDGCPDPDNDKDGTLDVNEGRPDCWNVAGPPENKGCPWPDTDGDGVLDKDEARPECVTQPEDKDGFADADGCPDDDNDADGVPDLKEARPECVNQPEDKDSFEDEDGCPDLDNDKDGTPDTKELRAECVNKPGPVENRGCPDEDRDSDGVVDRSDNCPAEAGPASNQGCPVKQKQLVVIKTGKIEILETVFFEEGKAVVLPKSFALLDNVTQVVATHPEIDHLRIEGHTDDQGKDEQNIDLSERRAQSVVAYLVKKGVDPKRLESKGYGPTKPIADNKTKEGRAKNRRVEFNVVMPGDAPDTETAPSGEKGGK